jgi:nucleotide-binding universal stress UspA family protein
MATYPVVVGVDGSEESLLAAEWAALEAKRHRLPLRIVSAPVMPPRMQAYQVSPAVASTLRHAARRALGTAVIRGHPARILANYSVRADLVVIGRHGDPGIGSVQHALLDHARGPVAVVPSDNFGSGEIL